jgi:hypothetical protein
MPLPAANCAQAVQHAVADVVDQPGLLGRR